MKTKVAKAAKRSGLAKGVGGKNAKGRAGAGGEGKVNGVEVRGSRIHGRGVFALRRFVRGERVGVFAGRRTRRDGTHVLWVDDGRGGEYGILGRNDLRYLNHSPNPNAEFDGEELRATRTIPPKREITIHYGDDWTDSS